MKRLFTPSRIAARSQPSVLPRQPRQTASIVLSPSVQRRHATTAPIPTPTTTAPILTKSSTPARQRVVILGSGWAGYGLARSLSPKKYERILISPRSHFVFTPLLASTSVGTLEFRAVVEPVRRLGLDDVHLAWADSIDFEKKKVRIEPNLSSDSGARGEEGVGRAEMFDVEYDKLVIAVGSYSQTFGVPGVREHAHFLRDVGDARAIRMDVLRCFETCALPTTSEATRKRLLHFAVVGGGPTGIEYAAELHDLIHDDLVKLYPTLIPYVRITVYDIASKVLPMFDRNLAEYATELFRRQGISVKTEHQLERIRACEEEGGGVLLKIKGDGADEVGAGVVVWSTGLMQNPLVEKIISEQFRQDTKPASLDGVSKDSTMFQVQKDPKSGGILTDEHLRVLISPSSTSPSSVQEPTPLADVFAIGDCSVIAATPLPATAQVASQKAAYLARSLNRNTTNSTTNSQKPFRFRNLGSMAYLGSWRAIHQSSADELRGRAAWILWRMAYLTKSMSIRNKIMVPVYWFMTWVFGRDISRF